MLAHLTRCTERYTVDDIKGSPPRHPSSPILLPLLGSVLLPRERTQHIVADGVGIALQAAVVVDSRAAHIRQVITDNRSIPAPLSGKRETGIWSVQQGCGL